MKSLYIFIVFIFVSFVTAANSLSGRWIGTLVYKFDSDAFRLNSSLEITEDGNRFFGVLSVRNNEKGKIIGCDYLIWGESKRDKIELKRLQVIDNFGMNNSDVGLFLKAEGVISIDESGASIKASVFMMEETLLGPPGTLKLKKRDDELSTLTIDKINGFKKKYFPDSIAKHKVNDIVIRHIAYPQRKVEKPVIDFLAAKKNNPAVKVALYFDGVKLEEWSSAQDNYIEMDLNGLPGKTYIIVLKVETETTESVSFVMRRAGLGRVQDSKYTISYDKQLNLIMHIYERPS
ncbi:hypothetical protein PDL71_14580 [Lacibacter sp. MH-610]|uniref:hypothetical protein n=1 Tax=Lacibacter sp. MH-610 TaxID=3020883 RepID=UPI0038916BCF